jgi:acid phosphatase (class A)
VRASKLLVALVALLGLVPSIGATQNQSNPAPAPTHSGAQSSSSATTPAVVAPGWIAIDDTRLRELLPRWPEPSSIQGKSDVWAALLAQSQRTPQQAAEAEADATRGPFDWAATALQGTSLATRFTTASAPATASLLTLLQADGRELIRRANALHPDRPRPRTMAGFLPSLESEKRTGRVHSAWPSARGTTSYLWAETMALVLPEHAVRFRTAALRTAELRVIGGAHFPSDVVAAHDLAKAVWSQLKDEPRFLLAVAKAREEFAVLPR